MDAFGLPKNTDEEKAIRTDAIQAATKHAMEIPFQVMQTSYQSMEVMKAMVETGNPNSVTDAGVGALAARSAVMGAALNIRVNAGGLNDKEYVDKMLYEVNKLVEKTIEKENEILQVVNEKIAK